MELTLEEKARLLNGVGSWFTYDCNGKVPKIMMSDGPHGLRKQDVEEYADINKSKIATCFPTASAVASSWNPEMARLLASTLAKEAKKEDVSIVLGCGTNIKRSPLCGRNFEYFSEDPYLAGVCATNYIQAMEAEGVGSSLKHFACNNQETQRQTSNSSVDKRAMFEIYLKPFEMAVKGGKPSTIMGSYNRINGTYACANPYLLTEILRKRWGFEGAVISDWGATMNVVDCIKAGMDLEMPDAYGHHTREILDAVKEGRLSEEELDRAVDRVLALIEKVKPDGADHPVDYQEHNEIACRIATDAAVLLKHSGAFPIRKDQKILILGEMAENMRFQGGGSSHITTIETKNVLEHLVDAGFNITFSTILPQNVDSFDQIIYFCGLTDKLESEGYDRSSLSIPEDQIAMIEALTAKSDKVSLVTFGGAPFLIPCLDRLQDVLHMHLCGQAVGQACYRLLTGQVNPSGKLSETYPLSIEDTPCHGYWGRKSDNVPYTESIFVGYRYYETFDIPVEFEFGYGLSYTTFAYENLSLVRDGDQLHICYDLVNTGEVAGAEVSQVYVLNPQGNYMRPKKELKAFAKTYLNPGERKRVLTTIKISDLSVYDVNSDSFVTPAGTYTIAVGASCRKLLLSQEIQVEGVTPEENQRELYPQYFEAKPHFTLEGFLPLYGEDIPDFDHKEAGDYTVYDSLQDVCHQSWIGRRILGAATWAVGVAIKAPKDDPAYLMILNGMLEAPLDSLISVSNGLVKPGFTKWLVKKANRRE